MWSSLKKSRLTLITIFALSSLIVVHQGCSKISTRTVNSGTSDNSSNEIASRNNGEGYQGKLERFEVRNEQSPCQTLSGATKAPPNDVILLSEESGVSLVRENCEDIVPLALSDANYDSNNQLVEYGGKTFQMNSSLSMDQLPIHCPAGTSLIPPYTAKNILSSPLDFTTTDWYLQSGVTTTLNGSLMGLPLFNVLRQNGSQQWSRMTQLHSLVAGEKYSFSILVSSGSTSNVTIMFAQYMTSNVVFEVDVNSATGAVNTLSQNLVTELEVQSTPVAFGRWITVFFRPTYSGQSDIAFGPTPISNGDVSINLTAAKLESLNNVCQ